LRVTYSIIVVLTSLRLLIYPVNRLTW